MDNLTIIIPYRNGEKTIAALIESIPVEIPVLVVNDMSQPEPSFTPRAGLELYKLNKRGYFAGAVNAGIEQTSGDVLVLNQDIVFNDDEWVEELEQIRNDPAVGIAGDMVSNHPAWKHGYIQGTFMFLRRKAIEEIGLLNQELFPLWGCTAEWQVRAARKGWLHRPMQKLSFEHERGIHHFGSAITQAVKVEKMPKDLAIRTPPLITVIIPNHNHGEFLPQAVTSVMTQTFQAVEVIIVDDGSNDGKSARIAKELASHVVGVKTILERHEGKPSAINTGIENSFGRLIAILDADDMMKPDRLEKMYARMVESAEAGDPNVFIYDDIEWFDPDDIDGGTQIMVSQGHNPEQILFKNHIHTGIMFPKYFVSEHGGYPVKFIDGREDWAMNVKLTINGWKGLRIPDYAGYIYRRHGDNRTLENTNPDDHKRFSAMIAAMVTAHVRAGGDVACCGNGIQKLIGNVQQVNGNTTGEMVTLEYVGGGATRSYTGNTTRRPYKFGGRQVVGQVHKDDANHLLSLTRNRHVIFKIYEPEKAA